jgi:hypothetical protein
MTTHDRDDERLRGALAELRTAERAGAPPFATVLARRAKRPASARRPSMRVALLAAALVLLASGTAYRAIVARRPLRVPREVVALVAWRPPTDVFLTTPGSALLRTPPPLGASLLGATPVVNTQTGGDRQ